MERPADPTPKLPREQRPAPERRLDSSTVARVLRRASQSEIDERRLACDADQLTGIVESALLAAADEVGMSVEAVKRSLAVERLGPPPRSRRSDRVFGSLLVSVDGEVGGSVGEILMRLDAWLVAGHHLRRESLDVSDSGGSAEWSKRAGLVGITVRRIRAATGEGRLGDLERVSVRATATGSGTCIVRITGDRSKDHRLFCAGGVAVAAAGTAGVVVAAVVVTPLVLLTTPAAVAAGVGVAARGRVRTVRTEREINRLLRAVKAEQPPTRLSIDVARRVTGRQHRETIQKVF